MPVSTARRSALAAALLLALACGGDSTPPANPYSGPPPQGAPIARTEGTAIAGTGADAWRWVPFPDAFCTDARAADGDFGSSATGLAISWGDATSTDVVVFLQGGGACWDFLTCGGAQSVSPDLGPTANTGPFGPDQFAANIFAKYPNAWVHREKLPSALQGATIVFVPYCTGDVHGGDALRTYAPPKELAAFGLAPITWHHSGHANVLAFLKRLGPTFPSPGKLVVAGSSAGGFGSLANYPAFRWYWPNARSYLLDDSGPPLVGDDIPPATRATWFASWNLGESLDAFCTGCRADMSEGIRELARRYPSDRLALVSHLEDATIRSFFGTFAATTFTQMDAPTFETALRRLGTDVMDPVGARYFFTNTPTPDAHPSLEDPTRVTTPGTGVAPWVEQMLSDDPAWKSASDP